MRELAGNGIGSSEREKDNLLEAGDLGNSVITHRLSLPDFQIQFSKVTKEDNGQMSVFQMSCGD